MLCLLTFCCSCICILVALIISAILLVLFLIFGRKNCFLLDIQPKSYKIGLPHPESNESKYKSNSLLNDAVILFPNQLIGPKSVAVARDGRLFTGTYGGHVYEVRDDKSLDIYTTIPNGRPIGMRCDSKNNLYFTEANSGLYVSDLTTKSVHKLVSFEDTRHLSNCGQISKFFDDLVIVETSDETSIYLTDVSRKFTLDYWSYVYLEPDPTGRVLRYDMRRKQLSVVLDHLWFPNGIEVNDERNALLINELTKRRVLKHYISGPKTGTTEVLVENLPGEPDNIRRSLAKEETYWIGLALKRDSKNTTLCDRLSDKPIQRKLLLRFAYILGLILNKIGNTFGIQSLSTYGTNLRTGLQLVLPDLIKYPGMGLEIDSKGRVVSTIQCSEQQKVRAISEITEVCNSKTERVFYLGAAGATNLSKLTIRK